jgi:hypothetical protein
MRARSRAFLTGSILAAALAAPALAEDINVPMDQTQMVTFDVPVRTVFVGNPLVADVNVVDSRHVFVLGKNFGTTNLIALDDNGNEAVNSQVNVFRRNGAIVTLQRGVSQTTLACDVSRCEATPSPGDDAKDYDNATGQIGKHQELTLKAAAQ